MIVLGGVGGGSMFGVGRDLCLERKGIYVWSGSGIYVWSWRGSMFGVGGGSIFRV